MTATAARPTDCVIYDGACGFCSRWVPSCERILVRAGFSIAPLQSPWLSGMFDLDAPETWQLVVLRADDRQIFGAEAYRYILRRIRWTYPLYLLSIVPGLRWVFNRAYAAFAQNRYCVSRICGLHAPRRSS